MQLNIDLTSLKVYALLMCIGTHKQKCKAFCSIINHKKDKMIYWASPGLFNAFKKLIFFSEIFPKKYFNEFIDEI